MNDNRPIIAGAAALLATLRSAGKQVLQAGRVLIARSCAGNNGLLGGQDIPGCCGDLGLLTVRLRRND